MPLVIIILIIIVIAFVYAILRLILTAFFGFLFLLSTNALLFIEKCFFISNAIPPWVSWGIFGLIIGLVIAAYKEAPRYGKAHLRPLLIVFQIGLIGGLCLYNMNRLQGAHEATSEIQSYQPKISTNEKLNLYSKKTQESFIKEQIVYLSDIEPAFVNVGWGKFERDVFRDKYMIRLNFKDYDRGLNTHAPAHATYYLSKKYSRFESYIGLWDSGNQHRGLPGDFDKKGEGSVIFQVWLDGEKKYDSGILKSTNTEHINISVEGVVKMELVVDPTSDGNRYDWSVWGDAKLVCSETKESVSQKGVSNCLVSVAPDRWKGEYFNNNNLQGSPSLVRDDGNGFINADWGNKGPCNWKDNFSVRWTRTVSFDKDTYRFMVTSDDGVRLYIDDQLKLGRWNDQEATTYTTDVQLPAGRHTIRLEYYENDGNAVAKLSWQALPTPEQQDVQSLVTYDLTGEWDGKIDNKKATLKITQDGNSLSGNIVYGNVTEFLSGEINNDQVVLRGTLKGKNFALDTFTGTISSQDGDFIRGNYTDKDGNSGSWFVTKSKSSSRTLSQGSASDQNQSKMWQPQNSAEPQTTVPLQVKLTEALQKRPHIVMKKRYRGNTDIKSTSAELRLDENGVLTVQSVGGEYINVECKWSSRESSYIGTWRDARRTRGKVILRPIYNDSAEIKCFSGHLGVGNGPLNAVIKVSNLLCLCPDPPDYNPSTRDQYRKPKSPSVHTYETNRSYHWGK